MSKTSKFIIALIVLTAFSPTQLFSQTRERGDIPVKDWVAGLQPKDRARILACLKNVEELGFNCPRVQFRQIRGCLWEIKIRAGIGCRIFFVTVKADVMVLLHSYKKQSQKAPKKEIDVAEKRMMEVLSNEKNYA